MNNHIPVLSQELINSLNIIHDGIYVDCTAGRCGHSKIIASKLKAGKLFCLDQDDDAIAYAKKEFQNNKNVYVIKSNFIEIDNVLRNHQIQSVDGIIYDLGVSSPMFDNPLRGFSYHNDGKLDMRMDQTQKKDAHFIINNYSDKQLIKIFRDYGEINSPNNVVRAILKYRKTKTIDTTLELVEIIKKNIQKKELFKDKHPAKKYFQAIRIEVNDELNVLQKSLLKAINLLNHNGRIAVITFHSLEDRIVKNTFNCLMTSNIPKEVPIMEKESEYYLESKKPILPTIQEIENNRRARSAKLRVLIRK